MIFRIGAEMDVIYLDFSRENTSDNPSVDSNE